MKQPTPEQGWRLLNDGEIIKEGDKFFYCDGEVGDFVYTDVGSKENHGADFWHQRKLEPPTSPVEQYQILGPNDLITEDCEYRYKDRTKHTDNWDKVQEEMIGNKGTYIPCFEVRKKLVPSSGPTPTPGWRLVEPDEIILKQDQAWAGLWINCDGAEVGHKQKEYPDCICQTQRPPFNPSQPKPITTTMTLEEQIKAYARQELSEDISNISSRVHDVSRRIDEKSIDLDAVDKRVQERLKDWTPEVVRIVVDHKQLPPAPIVELQEHQHPKLKEALEVLASGIPVALIGPTGSGKTLAARQLSKLLASKNFCSKQMSRSVQLHDFIGYTTASGSYVPGYLVPVILEGGLGFVDECDNGNENTLMILKGIFSKHLHIPFHGMTIPHDECRILAAMNTWGTGATREYIGRNALDAAFMNEFYTVEWDYDVDFEKALATSLEPNPSENSVRIFYGLQELRANIAREKFKIIVSTRNILNVLKLVQRGMRLDEVLRGVIFRNTSQTDVERVLPNMLKDSKPLRRGMEITRVQPLFEPPTDFIESKDLKKDAPF